MLRRMEGISTLPRMPGYAGHLTGVRNTVGVTYSRSTAEALGGEGTCKAYYPSAILGHRKDGYTTPAHPDFPFKDDIYRKRPAEYFAKVIPRYAGHRPGWTHSYSQTVGKYAAEKMLDFTQTTRKKSKTMRMRTTPQDILALPDPVPPPPRQPLYDANAMSYIPNTTLYTPAARERFAAGYSTLTRQAFKRPVPHIPAPLTNPTDGKAIDHLALPSSYMGFKPRALPFLARHLEAQQKAESERQAQIEALQAQKQAQEEEAAAEAAAAEEEAAQESATGEAAAEEAAATEAAAQVDDAADAAQAPQNAPDYPEEMYEMLELAQGDADFVAAVEDAAGAYRRELNSNGEAAAMSVWADLKASLEMTFLK